MGIGYKERGFDQLWTGYKSFRLHSFVRTILYCNPEQAFNVWDYIYPFYGWNIEGKYKGVWL